jgi:pSer/pThr/pTyr-binding forkhead associated (FHA) protein
MLPAKRISNRHCLITRLDDPGLDDASPWLVNNDSSSNNNTNTTNRNRSRPSQEPVVLIEDLNSSNGTFVNSHRITRKQVLRHGDEVSLGSNGPVPSMGHDVRWIYKSVGRQGVGDEERVGEIFERFHFEQT